MASFTCPKPFPPRILLSILISFSCILAPASARLGRSCHGSRTAFSFPDFSNNSQSLTLLGDAQIADSVLQFSGSQPQSVGGMFYSKPVRFLQPFRPGNSLSFSSFFSFSMAPKGGPGLAFVIAPNKNFYDGVSELWRGLSPAKIHIPPHTMVIKFDTSMNEEVKPDPNGIHHGPGIKTWISTIISLATANVADNLGHSLGLNDGERLFVWIDYRASVYVLEVRLSKSESERPENPNFSFRNDLSNLWTEEMFVGFSSSMEDSHQKHVIYSWSFATIDTRVQPGRFGPRFDHQGWQGFNGGPDPRHPELQHPHRDKQHGPPDHHVLWAVSMGVGELLLGATCGIAVACIRRRFGSSDEDGEAGGILYGYQKLTTTGTEGKADINSDH